MTTFKQLTKDGVLKRADAYKVLYSDIVVDPLFNTRDEGERLEAHIQGIFEFIMAGGQLPPMEVVPTPDGKVKVVDGHNRHRAYGKAIAAGLPLEWIEVKQFLGNDVERAARIVTSNEGLKLTQLELARVYARLRGYGLGPEEIAKRVGKTRQHVDQLLHLADAPHQVHLMVQAGTVSPTEAIKVARKHGDDAAEVLGKAAATAPAGKRLTGKTLKPWTPPAKIAVNIVDALDEVESAVPTETRLQLHSLAETHSLAGATVPIAATALWALMNQVAAMNFERNRAATRARQKAEAAAQTDIEQVTA